MKFNKEKAKTCPHDNTTNYVGDHCHIEGCGGKEYHCRDCGGYFDTCRCGDSHAEGAHPWSHKMYSALFTKYFGDLKVPKCYRCGRFFSWDAEGISTSWSPDSDAGPETNEQYCPKCTVVNRIETIQVKKDLGQPYKHILQDGDEALLK